ncbi:S-adenosyl-l-methionine hydroxide adenosyltransferase family protein [Flavihumibacter sediminis]|nr:S-adenosyl-l-methionine hydroxide adenosyltransferase family protein [Flavihumibacter sediminis]
MVQKKHFPLLLWVIAIFLHSSVVRAQNGAMVYLTDFGLKDGAVAAMKGVAFGVSSKLKQFDLTHEIPPFNIWEGAYRLQQTLPYWPAGTVFIVVVDPGVGSDRLPVVAKTKAGHYIVTPDNGTLTLVADGVGIDSLRQIDETINRLPGSGDSYTFHGRDVFAYTAARLAAGVIQFQQVGNDLPPTPKRLPYQKAVLDGDKIRGNIPVLDPQYGNIWTNIPVSLLKNWGIKDNDRLEVEISDGKRLVYKGMVLYGNTFSDVPEGKPVAYVNSLLNLSFGINMGNFAATHKVSSGSGWTISIRKLRS